MAWHLAPTQVSFEETYQWWWAVGNNVSDWTSLWFEHQTSCTDSDVLTTKPSKHWKLKLWPIIQFKYQKQNIVWKRIQYAPPPSIAPLVEIAQTDKTVRAIIEYANMTISILSIKPACATINPIRRNKIALYIDRQHGTTTPDNVESFRWCKWCWR